MARTPAGRSTRRWKDALGDEWNVRLYVEGADHPDTGETLPFDMLHFDDEDRTVEVHVRGDPPEHVSDFEEPALELALVAAKDERGFLFVDLEGHFWWVKRGSEDELEDQGYPIVFDDGTDERRHPGPLPAPADDLSDDEIEELLDQARGVAA